jgi:hypothetical protein
MTIETSTASAPALMPVPRRTLRTGIALGRTRRCLPALVAVVIASLAGAGTAFAQSAPPMGAIVFAARDAARPPAEPRSDDTSEDPGPDRFFPGAGHVSIGAASGVPFAAIGEISIGVADEFTVGVLGGVADTMNEAGVGGRFQGAIWRTHNFEMVVTMPVLYYPPSKKRGGESWILANPAVLFQGRLPWRDVRVYGGLGGLAASCTDSLFASFGARPSRPHLEPEPATAMVDGIWNTVHFGGSVPTTKRTSLFLDGSVILSGFTVSQSYARTVGVPAVAELGFSARF